MEYYLKHHGIEGQKWGKKNGPPYPLDAEDHSAAERKAAGEYTKRLNTIDNNMAHDKRSLYEAKESYKKLAKKVNKMYAKGKDTTKVEERLQIRQSTVDKYQKKIDDGRKETEQILKEIKKSGIYDIDAKATERNVVRGYEYLISALGGVLTGYYCIPYGTAKGTKYTIKRKEDDGRIEGYSYHKL